MAHRRPCHPIERVWRALTDREALAQWLMPNDFEPVVGHSWAIAARKEELTPEEMDERARKWMAGFAARGQK